MRQVLTALAMLMHGKTQSWDSNGGRGGERDPRPGGDSYPIAEHYRDRYASAVSEHSKRQVLREAREELEQWRGHGECRHAGAETQEQRDDRMMREGDGFEPQIVAVRFHTSAQRVRKVRWAKKRDPETGKPLPGSTPVEKPVDMDRVRRYKAQGLSLRQIETLTGASKSAIHRMLGRAA